MGTRAIHVLPLVCSGSRALGVLAFLRRDGAWDVIHHGDAAPSAAAAPIHAGAHDADEVAASDEAMAEPLEVAAAALTRASLGLIPRSVRGTRRVARPAARDAAALYLLPVSVRAAGATAVALAAMEARFPRTTSGACTAPRDVLPLTAALLLLAAEVTPAEVKAALAGTGYTLRCRASLPRAATAALTAAVAHASLPQRHPPPSAAVAVGAPPPTRAGP